MDRWLVKLVEEYRAGNVKEAIALVKADTSTKWFQLLWDYPICFVSKRQRFVGNDNDATFASALVYLGSDTGQFQNTFDGFLGAVVQRMQQR